MESFSNSQLHQPPMMVLDKEEKRGVMTYNIINMPSEIIQKILSRFDAKSLMRFKCVCKSWRSLIQNPDFITLHIKRQRPNILLHQNQSISIRSLENFDHEISSHGFPIEKVDEKNDCLPAKFVDLVGSDSGILCFSTVTKDNVRYLWNPALKEVKTIPSSPGHSPGWERTYYLHGFGYDPLISDFKVVQVYGNFEFETLFRKCDQVVVYSLRRNSWRTFKMADIFSDCTSYAFTTVNSIPDWKESVVVNASIHWMLLIESPSPNQDSCLGIVAFDLKDEILSLIKSPQVVKGPYHVKTLAKFSECLSFITCDEARLVEIWVMKKYGVSNSWFKYLSFDFFTLPPNMARCDQFGYFLVGPLSNGNVLFVCYETGKVCWYDAKSKGLQNTCPEFRFAGQVTTYVESVLKLTG